MVRTPNYDCKNKIGRLKEPTKEKKNDQVECFAQYGKNLGETNYFQPFKRQVPPKTCVKPN